MTWDVFVAMLLKIRSLRVLLQMPYLSMVYVSGSMNLNYMWVTACDVPLIKDYQSQGSVLWF